MKYKGVIIEESLDNAEILKDLTVTGTEVETVTERFKTPWLKQWTLHTVEIPEANIDEICKKLSNSFDKEHPDWYADFKNDVYHYIVFPHKVFRVEYRDVENYRSAVQHGLSLGIPLYQLEFSPEIAKWAW